MIERLYARFTKKLGEPTYSQPVPKSSFEKYRSILPDTLLTIWEKSGWAS
ncbi:hypothetical protein MNBD_GAMMA08-350 [hydrothermal vent metagenome]|uniref:GAD-related domain-containing protein n=1 Tax=hydrothermal vent metagenome TaxID=652676 RepID=A0A3B0X8B6_9ZZZZ